MGRIKERPRCKKCRYGKERAVGVGRSAKGMFFLYNTICSVTIYECEENAEKLVTGVKDIASDIRRMLDFYDANSELGKLNREHRAGVPVQVSRELFEFIVQLLEFSEKSEGCFDPSVGPVVKLWNIPARQPSIPKKSEIETAKKRTGFSNIVCDREEQTIMFRKPGMMLDAGGAGKGYAVWKTVDFLKKHGVESAFVNFGGNLYVIGERLIPEGGKRPWKIGIQSPWKEYGQSLGMLDIKDCGIATSGGYDRFFMADGKVYHHLLDPRTGYPVENTLDSVTIISNNAFYTDLLSTACFVAGEKKVDQICRKVSEEIGYVLVKKDGSIIVSENMKTVFQSKGG